MLGDVEVEGGRRQRAGVVGQQVRWFVRDDGEEEEVHRTWRTLFLIVTRWRVSAPKT